MKKLTIGILAHVDAGKTTLSESMLYLSGQIRKLGRVDNKNAYLDTDELEKARGITIFSKQAIFQVGRTQITLLDTPGHIDFSAEMERTLQVLDYAILVISGSDGVQGHTQTLWRLLKTYNIPVFIFINKMDQKRIGKPTLMQQLEKQLSDGSIDFNQKQSEEFYDQLAMCDEEVMASYFQRDYISQKDISNLIKQRKVFPCFFGSALKLQGIEELMEAIEKYTQIPLYPKTFGAKVFKITRDGEGNRLTHLKVTGGILRVKDLISHARGEEKVNEIRLYSGEKFQVISRVEAGTVCAVTGLSQVQPGEGLGIESASATPILEPVLSYRILLPEDCDARSILPKLGQIEEEEPALRIVWNEELQEIQAQMMGEVQVEVLQSLIQSRFDINVQFDSGSIVYKETIGNTVEGVGHFEPLRHYAEVHLVLEPGEPGSGLKYALKCSEDMLDKSWQNLILSHLKEKNHKGVLTGSDITDLKITLTAGRAHQNHTEGGDFREATYRAVRQGLKQAKSILLEPYYEFRLEVPESAVGRAMTDIERMYGSSEILQTDHDQVVLVGSAPVVQMRNYHQEVMAYTKGYGKLQCSVKGYEPCHNTKAVMKRIGYDSEKDRNNPTGSIFCTGGAGFSVAWDQVHKYMHIPSTLPKKTKDTRSLSPIQKKGITLEEIDQLIKSTYSANQGRKSRWEKSKKHIKNYGRPALYKQREIKETYLLVDGYNVIYAWPELKDMVEENMDGARIKLLDYLSNYQGIKNNHIIVVFDAYRVEGQGIKTMDYYNIHVVYTKEAQTADHYIERFVNDYNKKYHIIVATSDALEQVIIRGKGAHLLSAVDLKEEIEMTNKMIMEEYEETKSLGKNYLIDALPKEIKQKLEDL